MNLKVKQLFPVKEKQELLPLCSIQTYVINLPFVSVLSLFCVTPIPLLQETRKTIIFTEYKNVKPFYVTKNTIIFGQINENEIHQQIVQQLVIIFSFLCRKFSSVGKLQHNHNF